METDLERYAWLVAYELREARSAATPEERRQHEALAWSYTLKMHALENDSPPFLLSGEESKRETPATQTPDPARESQPNLTAPKPGGGQRS